MSPANVTKKPVVTKSPAAKPPVKKATAPKPTPTSQSASKRPVPAAVQRKKKDGIKMKEKTTWNGKKKAILLFFEI